MARSADLLWFDNVLNYSARDFGINSRLAVNQSNVIVAGCQWYSSADYIDFCLEDYKQQEYNGGACQQANWEHYRVAHCHRHYRSYCGVSYFFVFLYVLSLIYDPIKSF